MAYGYRGSPCRLELGFNASEDFHLYTIEWQPGWISWSVDNVILHERGGWDPTPVPHLPMRLHGNLWAPRSSDLAGRIEESALPFGRQLPQRCNLDLKASNDSPGEEATAVAVTSD